MSENNSLSNTDPKGGDGCRSLQHREILNRERCGRVMKVASASWNYVRKEGGTEK